VSINDTEIRGHLHYLFINKNTIKRKRKKINDIEIRGHLLYLFIRKKNKKKYRDKRPSPLPLPW